MELRIYIANLGKYNEGKLVGDWFDLPVNFADVKKKIGLNEEYEEYAIHDYELPFKIGEYEQIDRLNHIAELFEENSHSPLLPHIDELLGYGVDSVEEFFERIEDFKIYHECKDMADVAAEFLEASGMLGGMSTELHRYFDYKQYGRDMKIQGTFIELSDFIVEYCG